jgi:hypothetical protein
MTLRVRVANRIIVWPLFQMQGRLSGPELTQRYTAKHRPVRPFCATSFHWRPLCSAALRNERGEHPAQQAKARLKLLGVLQPVRTAISCTSRSVMQSSTRAISIRLSKTIARRLKTL